MDYRERKYYLMHCNNCDNNEAIRQLKSKLSSIKIHSRYNHFRNNANINYLNTIRKNSGAELSSNRNINDIEAGYGYVSNMISVRIEEAELLEEICDFEYTDFFPWIRLVPLSKDLCNQ